MTTIEQQVLMAAREVVRARADADKAGDPWLMQNTDPRRGDALALSDRHTRAWEALALAVNKMENK
jgi:hypothetical protein